MTAGHKIALYALCIGCPVLAAAILQGQKLEFRNLAVVAVCATTFGAMIWLRWDWAMQKRRERRAAKTRAREADGR